MVIVCRLRIFVFFSLSFVFLKTKWQYTILFSSTAPAADATLFFPFSCEFWSWFLEWTKTSDRKSFISFFKFIRSPHLFRPIHWVQRGKNVRVFFFVVGWIYILFSRLCFRMLHVPHMHNHSNSYRKHTHTHHHITFLSFKRK